MRLAELLPLVLLAVAAVGAVASKLRARRRAAGMRVSGGRKAFVLNLLERR